MRLSYDHTRSKLFLKWPSIYETREILFLKFIALFSIINFMNRRISHKRDWPSPGDNPLAKLLNKEMNRTNDRDFFRLWDMECVLQQHQELPLKPKERVEVDILEENFFEAAGYYPSYQGYHVAIHNYQRNKWTTDFQKPITELCGS